MQTERGTDVTTPTLEQVGQELADFRARQAQETARLDAWDAETARQGAALRAHLDDMAADLRRTEVARALRAAQDERDGYLASYDWRARLAEYGLDEHGQPVEILGTPTSI